MAWYSDFMGLFVAFYVPALSAIESSTGDYHNFLWNGPSGTTLERSLQGSLEPDDFFYLFSGDTQHFYPCEYSNTGCLTRTQECTAPLTQQCIEKQSEWSNRYQQVSMRKLLDVLKHASGQLPKSLVLNGDLIQLGMRKEVDTFHNYWQGFDSRFPLYPGLGNHDYANNVGRCDHNNCTHRILSYFTSYVTQKLGATLDMKNETTANRTLITGSLAYSWDDCSRLASGGSCFHFVQQNNYPTYTRQIVSSTATWNITPSLSWLRNDLKDKAGIPTILNLHDFDTMFTEEAKQEFKKVLIDSKADVVAVFFAHLHEKVGLRSHWCLETKSRPILHIYSGSVPGNNYVLAQLSRVKKSLKQLYKVHVVNETTSSVQLEALSVSCPSSAGGSIGADGT